MTANFLAIESARAEHLHFCNGKVRSMKREDARALIEKIGILPSVRVPSRDLALFAAETVYTAGIPIVEITLTVPGALEVINDLARRFQDMVVGAGTVLDESLARQAIDAGARFITSPGFVPEVVSYANRADVLVLPGASDTNRDHRGLEGRFRFRKDFSVVSYGRQSIHPRP